MRLFIPFDLNKKPLLAKATSVLEKAASEGERYLQTNALLGDLQRYLQDLSFSSLPGSVDFTKLEFSSLIKAVGLEFQTEKTSICEQLLDYFELVTELDRKKLFITLNLRPYLTVQEADLFLDSVLLHAYNVIMIETTEYPRLSRETRVIVDRDLCVIT